MKAGQIPLFFALFVTGVLSLSGCVSKTVQADEFLGSPSSVPSSAHVEGVPFVEQAAGHCGPATLTMALNWAGKKITVEELAPQVFTPGMKGSLQTDLISASRRQGMMAVPISGLASLTKEIAAGHPVIVFENLSVSWLPQWHYAIVFGYDRNKEEVLMHSGPEAFKRWDLRKFERSWMLGDYWGLVVLPAERIAVSAGELANLTAASGLEQAGKLTEAEKAYSRILQEWPKNLPALIGLGNISFQNQRTAQAVDFLRQATKVHPDSAMAWHNLTIALGSEKRVKEARLSALRAIDLASAELKPTYRENLREWLEKAKN